MDAVLHELKYAIRTLRKTPGLTAVILVTLALSIGATSAIFSIADTLVGRPLRGFATDRLAVLAVGQKAPASAADYLDWRRLSRSFDRMAAYRQRDGNLTGNGLAERIYVAAVTPDFFSLIDADAAIGRVIGDADEAGGVALLSYAIWQRRFAGDPAIVGRAIRIDDVPHTVVGVLPKAFQFPVPTDVWIPLTLTPTERARRDALTLRVIGRLEPSTTVAAAQAELATISQQLESTYPATNLNRRAHVMPLDEFVQGTITRRAIFMLLVVVAVVLLVTCANISGVQLARATDRQREIAVRTALGATRSRVVQQVVIENAVIAGLGGAAGLAVAAACVRAMQRTMPAEIARLIPGFVDISIDRRALAFTVGVSIGTCVLTAALPALRSARARPGPSLNDGRTASSGRAHQRLRHVFVIAQLAVAFVLLLISTMFVSGFARLLESQTVHDPNSVLVLSAALPAARYSTDQDRRRFHEQVVERLAQIPGVRDAAAFTTPPLSNNGTAWSVLDVERQIPATPQARVRAVTQSVTPGFFRLLHIALHAGRSIERADDAAHPRVALVSRVMAAHLWPDGTAIGRRIRLANTAGDEWITVVGVVDDVLYDWTDRAPEFVVYVPAAQSPSARVRYGIRVNGDPAAFARAAREQIAAVDPLLPAYDVMSLREAIDQSLAGSSQIGAMMRLLGLLSAAIGIIGLYGVMAYLVATRTREFGVRIALGARPADVFRMVMGRAVRLSAMGLACGVALAIPAVFAVRGLVFDADSHVWGIGISMAVLLTAVAIVASIHPARRATRSDPMLALRSE